MPRKRDPWADSRKCLVHYDEGLRKGFWSTMEEYLQFVADNLPYRVALKTGFRIPDFEFEQWVKEQLTRSYSSLAQAGYDEKTVSTTMTHVYFFSDPTDAVHFKFRWA